jgi:hypothetical protein
MLVSAVLGKQVQSRQRITESDQSSSTAENQDTCSGSEQNSEHLTSIYAVLIVHAN